MWFLPFQTLEKEQEHKKIVQILLHLVENLGDKKELEEQEQDQSEVQFGEVVEELFHLPLVKISIKKLIKNQGKAALSSILSKKIDDKDLIVIDELNLDTHKTKNFIKVLKDLNIDSSVLIVTDKASDNLVLSSRNLHYCDIIDSSWLNPVLLLKYKKMLITSDSLKRLEGGLGV